MAVSKVILNGQTLIDVTEDTVASNNLLQGNQATGADGQKVSGAYVPPTFSAQAKTVAPSESQQTILPDAGYDGLSQVQIGAISSSYIGSGVPQKSSSDLTADEDIVTVPAGYYASSATKSVAQGTAGTPTAVKGAASNHSISITPMVTNTSGYIDGGTETGSAVSVTASELVSGTKTITENGTSDVTNYASVTVNVEPNVEALTVIPSESEQVFEGGTVDGYKPVTVSAIPSNYVGSGITRQDAKTVTPTETEQTVVSSGKYTTGDVKVAAISSTYVGTSITKKTAQIYTPSTTNQTIAAGQYLSGAQTILGDANLVASNIASGVSIFGVQGTHQGGVSEEDVNIKWITGNVSGSHSYSVTAIHFYAFAHQKITTISLPNVQTIPKCAFQECYSLSTINIPSCTLIQASAFYNCTSLQTISFPKCMTIGSGAFEYCTALSMISAPELGIINDNGLANTALINAHFPKCAIIGSNAFLNCKSLITVSLEMLKSVSDRTFVSCSSLQSVYIPACESIGSSAFALCGSLESLYAPICSYVGTYAFLSCTALSVIDLPECTSMSIYAFINCSALQTVSLPKCTSVGSSAFVNCVALQNVYMPECLTVQGQGFRGCTSLSRIELPKCTFVNGPAFSGCTNLEYLSLPALSSVVWCNFSNLSKLKSIYIPACSIISSMAFVNDVALESIDLPNCSIVSHSAFKGCTSLSLVKLSSVWTIGHDVFYDCVNLRSLYIYTTSRLCALVGLGAFSNTPLSAGGSGAIYVPGSWLASYASATNWSALSSRLSAIEDAP